MCALNVPLEGGNKPFSGLQNKGLTIRGSQWAPFEEIANNVSQIVVNMFMLNGDFVNFFKFFTNVVSWNTLANVFAFDLFNSFCCTGGGVAIFSGGVKHTRIARETDDQAGVKEGRCSEVIGSTLAGAGVSKGVAAAMGIAQFFQLLPAALVPLMTAIGFTSGTLFGLMFVGYAAKAYYTEKDVMDFRKEFRNILLEVLPEKSELPENGTPKELFEKAHSLLKKEKKEFASEVMRKLQEKIPQSEDESETKLEMVNDTEKNEWKAKVNFEHLLTRATKGDIVKEIRQGYLIDGNSEESSMAVLDHLFEKWTTRRDWNRRLGVVALIVIPIIIALLACGTGPIPIVLSLMIVGLFVVFALGFDGRGYFGSLREKEPGKWDGLLLVTSTVLLLGVMITFAMISVATGGVVPLIYCLVVGGLCLVFQLGAIGWVAKCKAEQKKKYSNECGLTDGTRSEWKECQLVTFGDGAGIECRLTDGTRSEWNECQLVTFGDGAGRKKSLIPEIVDKDLGNFKDFHGDVFEIAAEKVNPWLADIGDVCYVG